MRRFLPFRKADTANLLEYGLFIGLIMVVAIGTVFLVAKLASGQWMALNAILP